MVKIERIENVKTKNAKLSLEKAKQHGTTYNTPQVNEALYEVFHGKCYICENKEGSSYQIEHLRPHKKKDDLKYDWDNLFLVCAHCNNIKLGKYDNILDCTKEEIDKIIAFRKKGYFGKEETLEFEALDHRVETKATVLLLENVYCGTTSQKRIEAKILRTKLRKELSRFKELVREYYEAEGTDKEDLEFLLRKELRSSSAFTAFKRWLIRDNHEYYSELLQYING